MAALPSVAQLLGGVALASVVAACAPTPPTPTVRMAPSPVGASPPIATPAPSITSPTGGLVVNQRRVGSGLYTEGAVAFVEIRDAAGAIVSEAQTPDYHLDIEVLRTELPVGSYELRSFVRPCEAACPLMDAPTDACVLGITIDAGSEVEVLVERRIGQPCVATTAGG